MIKNNSIELGAYVSPAIKIAQIKARRVMCTSPYGSDGDAGPQGSLYDNTDEEDY